jgi:hypothetical protein
VTGLGGNLPALPTTLPAKTTPSVLPELKATTPIKRKQSILPEPKVAAVEQKPSGPVHLFPNRHIVFVLGKKE